MNESNMKKSKKKPRSSGIDEDTMRPEYDFSKAVRGVTAARYAEGTNVVLLDPDVAEIFPDTRAVNEALRTMARVTRTTLRHRARKRTLHNHWVRRPRLTAPLTRNVRPL
jgi:hypothetical protein